MTMTPEYFEHDLDALFERAEKAEAAVGTLQTALRQFVGKLDLILPIVDGYIALTHLRSGGQYAGPNIVAELEAARALLPALEPTP